MGANVALLRAIDLAAEEAENDGWAVASDIRAHYDGVPSAAGSWARNLWALKAAGLAETVSDSARPGCYLWGLTEAGAAALLAGDRA